MGYVYAMSQVFASRHVADVLTAVVHFVDVHFFIRSESLSSRVIIFENTESLCV